MRDNSTTRNPTACIIGSGPYGVSIAAYLQFAGINFRIFGSPMRRWLSQMPEKMLLKSESSCASSLYEPTGLHTLERYCKNEGTPFPEYGTPVSREVFTKYALSFQRTLVPNVEDVTVTAVTKSDNGFELRLSSGEMLEAEKVIIAIGMDHMAYIPKELSQLPAELISHSADHYDLSCFRDKDVTVIGGGQSGLETAAILHEQGTSVRLIVRKPFLVWNGTPTKAHRPGYQRLRYPRTRFGDGLGHWVYDNVPGLFRYLPQRVRLERVRTALGPAGAWWLKDRIVGKLPVLQGHRVCEVSARDRQAVLQVTDQHGQVLELTTDHVIAATGYKFNIQNLPFLSQCLKLQLQHEEQSPRLSSHFESSIPGMYFTGLASANSFGPAMRFLAGADYTARRITRHLARAQQLRTRPFAKSEKCPEFSDRQPDFKAATLSLTSN